MVDLRGSSLAPRQHLNAFDNNNNDILAVLAAPTN